MFGFTNDLFHVFLPNISNKKYFIQIIVNKERTKQYKEVLNLITIILKRKCGWIKENNTYRTKI